jgi:hypothetical protein
LESSSSSWQMWKEYRWACVTVNLLLNYSILNIFTMIFSYW